MKKKVHILCDDRHDYVAKVKDEKIKLKFSKDEGWSEHIKGTEIGTIKDHGNGIRLKFRDLDLNLDYCEFVELYFLCHVKIKEDKNMTGKVDYLKK